MDQLVVPAMVYFLAQVIDVDIDDVRDPAEFGFRPDVVGDCVPGEGHVGVVHEKFEEGEFLRGKGKFLAVAECLASDGVNA